jgi:hypothetical protein
MVRLTYITISILVVRRLFDTVSLNAYTTVLLKVNFRVPNKQKTSKLKIKILIYKM